MKTKQPFKLFICLLIMMCFLTLNISGQDVNPKWSERMADIVIADNSYKYLSDYVEATAMKGFRNLWKATGDSVYFNYLRDAADLSLQFYYNLAQQEYHDIDPVNGGSLLLFMYSLTGNPDYKNAADSALKFLQAFPRSPDGGFYHKDVPRMQIDDLFMGTPFLAECGKVFNSNENYDDAINQAILMEKHTRDSLTGLYFHVWYAEGDEYTPAGTSPYLWGRGVGWVAMALVDMLDFLPLNYTGRDSVVAVFQRLADAISNIQDEITGVWWQVLDQGERSGNFLESSASTMFVYALAKAIRLDYIDESYWNVVEKGYRGILDNFIRENTDGTFNITNVCPGQSPGYYYDLYIRPTYENGHALGPFIMASVEVEKRGIIPSNLMAVTLSGNKVNLTWNDNSDDEDGFIIERASGGDFTEIAVLSTNVESYQDTTLSPLTTYTYRVRMFKGDTRSVYSNYSGTTTLAANGAPAYASQPDPANGSDKVDVTSTLQWLPGPGTTTHDIYFGKTNPPLFVINQADSVFVPDSLEYNSTYYWKIDEVNSAGTTEGFVWSFTTNMAKGLVAHWTMDENAGNIIHDATEYGNNGTLNNMDNAAWVPGISGSALQFDGIDDFIVVPHDRSLNFGEESFSISFWLNQTVTDRNMTYMIKGTHEAPGSGKRYEVLFDRDSTDIMMYMDDDFSDPVEMYLIPGKEFITDEWVHIVAVRYSNNDQIQIFYNTEVIGAGWDNMLDISQDEDLYIGVSPDQDSTYFVGALDDVRLYNRALSQSQIQSIYNEQFPEIIEQKLADSQNMNLKNYPNPFVQRTNISFTLSKSEHVKLTIYNLMGQEIEIPVNQIMTEGTHQVEFDASGLNSSTYIGRLCTDSRTMTAKMVKY